MTISYPNKWYLRTFTNQRMVFISILGNYKLRIFINNKINPSFNHRHWIPYIVFICQIHFENNCNNIHIRYMRKFISLIVKILNGVYQKILPVKTRFVNI